MNLHTILHAVIHITDGSSGTLNFDPRVMAKSQLHGCWTTGLAPIAVSAGIPEREGFLSLASDVPTNGHICFTSAIL